MGSHLPLAVAAALVVARFGVAQTPAAAMPSQWAVAPPLLPRGALIAVVSGDPAGPGESTIELSMPDGYRMPPHFHPTDERIEVKQGTLLVGTGDRLDARKTMPVNVGDTAVAPAGVHHYSVARGETVVGVTFIGTYTITYVNPSEARDNGPFPSVTSDGGGSSYRAASS